MTEIVSLGITYYELIFLISSCILFTNLIWNIQKKLDGKDIEKELEDSSVVYIKGGNLLKQIDDFQNEMLGNNNGK